MKRVMKSGLCIVLALLFLLAPMSGFAAGSRTCKILRTTVANARLREGPGDYTVITTLPKGEKVYYLNRTEGAYHLISTTSGIVGYVYKGYLEEYGACKLDAVYYVSSSSLAVYRMPDTGSRRVGTLSRRTYIVVRRINGSWAQIRTLDGRVGFVKVSGLKKAVD